MKTFIFDVDGTLTPSRGVIDIEFKRYFNKFCRKNKVCLVTGSDKSKTIEQLGEDTYNLCHAVYNCNGNDVWQGNKHIRSSKWIMPSIVYEWLSDQLNSSYFKLRTGNHFEERPGMVNFSIVGRNATQKQRQEYVKWDNERHERMRIADQFNLVFPELEATVGGETGIDISLKNSNKSQILKDFYIDEHLIFFGDAMYKDGNDFELAEQIIDNSRGDCYNIKNWAETWKILESLCQLNV
jgi:phosphomannomutase